MKEFWQLSVDEVISALGTHLSDGLSTAEAEKRYQEYGPNRLKEKKGRAPVALFFDQFRDFIIWVLIGAALVSGLLKEWVDTLVILGIVLLNAVLGFIQEFKAEKSLTALKKLFSPTTRVIRNKQHLLISSVEVVPGDVVELESGDYVPADSRVVWHTSNFSVQEASLTGESHPVMKTKVALKEKDIPLADRANMVYMGTSVVAGKAKVVVIDTGMQTELGKIADMLQDIRHETTPLQKKLEEFSRLIVRCCFLLVGMVFLLEYLRGGRMIDVFLTAVSLAVAAIPEGLPAVVTIVLALSVQRMIKRNVLIRKLPSVETLGCATVICSDKTGTLTKNEMTVQKIFTANRVFTVTGVGYEPKGEFLLDGKQVEVDRYPQLQKLLRVAVLCNGAQLIRDGQGYRIVGDPTEAGLLTAGAKAGIWKEEEENRFAFVDEIPFDSERKKMTIIRNNREHLIAFVKGAPEGLLEDCRFIENNGTVDIMTQEDRQKILRVNSEFANQAMRVLAVAYHDMGPSSTSYKAEAAEDDLVFLGLVAMIDPPRPEAKESVAKCKQAGIKTIMITGDHKNTAVSIGRELGIYHEDSLALTGEELDALSEETLLNKVKQISVYARVSSEHKLRVVRAWRRNGEVVAMTGDGVNDAPAVKEADIGVAMGITGTDVTKEVSDMVITDDNFTSIVSAVEEGRGIYDNIKKFVHYLLSCNTGEILVMFVSALAGLPVPLLPIHILWVNLVTDGLPALALGVEPIESNVMSRPPRKPDEPVVSKKRFFIILFQGVFLSLCSLLVFILILFVEKAGICRARTAVFLVLSCSQLFHSLNCRSMTRSVFELGIFSNIKLVFAIIGSFLLQVAVIYLPFGQKIFRTEVLGGFDWFMVVVLSSFPLWAMELCKIFIRRKKIGVE